MGKKERLIKNTLILLIGVIGTKLINFLMLPLFTAWLSVEEYGTIDIFTVVISMVVPLLSLQLDQGVFRFMIDDQAEIEKKETVTSGISLLCLVLFIANIICVPTLIILQKKDFILYMVAIDLQCLYVMLQQIVRGMGKNKIYSVNSMLLAFTNVLSSVVFIRFMGMGVNGYILAFCISHVFAGLFMVVSSRIKNLIDWSCKKWDKAKEILQYSLPMIVNNVSWWILNASDKLVLNLFCGLNANGIFAASGKIPGLITTVYSVFHLAWQESAAREKEDTSEFYSYVFRRLFVIMSYALIVLLCLGPTLFSFLINIKFAESYNHMPILLLALFFYCIAQFYGGIYVGYKKSKELGYTSAIAAVVNLVIDFALVQKVRIYAASISTLVAYFALMLIRLVSIRKICSIKYEIREIAITVAIICVAMVCAYVNNTLLLVCVLLFATIVYIFMFNGMIKELKQMVTDKLAKR